MRLGVIGIFLLLPQLALAACSAEGVTVVYVNGILTSERQAQQDLENIRDAYFSQFPRGSTFFKNGYNPSHFEGIGDVVQATFQIFGRPVSTFDRDTILLQIHPEVTTRRLLLVGHSQGTFYTNEMYEYLLSHGEPKEAIGVYNLASPAIYVAGNGKYLNSSNDRLLDLVEKELNKAVLLRNINIPLELDDVASWWPGHGISRAYLAGASEKVVADIESSISALQPSLASDTAECFSAPERSVSYKAKEIIFSAGDVAVKGAFVAGKAGWQGAVMALNGAKTGLAAVGSFFDSVASAVTPNPRTENLPGSFTILRGMYGSSLTEEDLKDFGLIDQGGAVILAFSNQKVAPEDGGEVQAAQEEKPFSPLIPPPLPGGELVSPGFGGGGSSEPISESGVSSTVSSPAAVVVPDGVPPQVVAIAADGFSLQQSYSSIRDAPMATSGTVWLVRMEFDEDISATPTAIDLPPNSPPGTSHAVNDCGDADQRSFCFSYPATANIQLLEWRTFEISGAKDVSGETMLSKTYLFSIDTAAPTVVRGATGRNTILPVIDGTVSQNNMPVQVSVDGNYYQTTAMANYWFVTLGAGHELAAGLFDVYASSTDSVGNTGPVAYWQILVDLSPPMISLTPDVANGAQVGSSTPFVGVTVGDDNAGVTHICEIDGAISNNCTGLDVSSMLPGSHVFKVTATDVGGNEVVLSRTFDVLP